MTISNRTFIVVGCQADYADDELSLTANLEEFDDYNWFEDEQGRYLSSKLIDVSKSIKPITINIKDLLNLPSNQEGIRDLMLLAQSNELEKERVEKANMSFPILIKEDNTIVDGFHRVLKSLINKATTIPAKKLTPKILEQSRITSESHNLLSKRATVGFSKQTLIELYKYMYIRNELLLRGDEESAVLIKYLDTTLHDSLNDIYRIFESVFLKWLSEHKAKFGDLNNDKDFNDTVEWQLHALLSNHPTTDDSLMSRYKKQALDDVTKWKNTFNAVINMQKELRPGPNKKMEENFALLSRVIGMAHIRGDMLEHLSETVDDPAQRVTPELLDQLSSGVYDKQWHAELRKMSSVKIDDDFFNAPEKDAGKEESFVETRMIELWHGVRDSISLKHEYDGNHYLTPNPKEAIEYRKLWFVPAWNETNRKLALSYADYALVKVKIPFKFNRIRKTQDGKITEYTESYAPVQADWERTYQVQEYYLYNGILKLSPNEVEVFNIKEAAAKLLHLTGIPIDVLDQLSLLPGFVHYGNHRHSVYGEYEIDNKLYVCWQFADRLSGPGYWARITLKDKMSANIESKVVWEYSDKDPHKVVDELSRYLKSHGRTQKLIDMARPESAEIIPFPTKISSISKRAGVLDYPRKLHKEIMQWADDNIIHGHDTLARFTLDISDTEQFRKHEWIRYAFTKQMSNIDNIKPHVTIQFTKDWENKPNGNCHPIGKGNSVITLFSILKRSKQEISSTLAHELNHSMQFYLFYLLSLHNLTFAMGRTCSQCGFRIRDEKVGPCPRCGGFMERAVPGLPSKYEPEMMHDKPEEDFMGDDSAAHARALIEFYPRLTTAIKHIEETAGNALSYVEAAQYKTIAPNTPLNHLVYSIRHQVIKDRFTDLLKNNNTLQDLKYSLSQYQNELAALEHQQKTEPVVVSQQIGNIKYHIQIIQKMINKFMRELYRVYNNVITKLDVESKQASSNVALSKRASAITNDFDVFKQKMIQYCEDLETSMSREEVEKFLTDTLFNKTLEAYNKLQTIITTIIKTIPSWNNSPIKISVPFPYSTSNSDADWWSNRLGGHPPGAFWVVVGKQGFTYFDDGTIDDVLDVGVEEYEPDMFANNKEKEDYYTLVFAIQSGSQPEKKLYLYSGRAKKDRDALTEMANNKKWPKGIWLTDNMDLAYSIGADYGEERDLWKVVVSSKNVMFDASGSVGSNNYQLYGAGETVDIYSARLLSGAMKPLASRQDVISKRAADPLSKYINDK